MDFDKSVAVFTSDEMKAKHRHDIPGWGIVTGNSFTRNHRLYFNTVVQITVDQDKLARTNKIVPLDGHYVFYNAGLKKKSDMWRGRYNPDNTALNDLSEEFVTGDIKPLHRYVTHIEIVDEGAREISGDAAARLYVACRKFSRNFGIVLKAEPSWVRDIGAYLRGKP